MKHRVEFGADMLATPIGANGVEMPRHADRDQDQDHRRRNDQNPQRQPQRSDDD